MKTVKTSTLLVVFISIFISCQHSNNDQASKNYRKQNVQQEQIAMSEVAAPVEEEAVSKNEDKAYDENVSYAADSAVSNGLFSSSAAKDNGDVSKKFVRTADVKFRVQDVTKASLKVEDITAKFGGYVSYTNLENNVLSSTTENYKEDSLIEVQKTQMVSNIVLRVPNTKLDSLLRELGGMVTAFDYRKITADDVSLQYLMNEKVIKAKRRKAGRLEYGIDSKGRRLYEITDAEDYLTSAGLDADGKEIENLGLLADVQFSKVVINMYQLPVVTSTIVVSDRVYDNYKPSFGYRLVNALEKSWNGLLEIILMLMQVWYLIVLLLLGVWATRKYAKRSLRGLNRAA